MKYSIGQLVIGKVVSIKPYAVFMEFENETKGLLHISEISDGYVRDIEKYASIGDLIKVLILSIDPLNGFLRLSYKKVPTEEHYNTHINKRRKPNIASDDFKILKDNLDRWIEQTLKKANNQEEDKND